MNLNGLLNYALRIITRRAVNMGVNKAIDLASTRGKPAADMTEEDKAAAQSAKVAAARVRQAARVSKRFMR
jgi:hypothetical protein